MSDMVNMGQLKKCAERAKEYSDTSKPKTVSVTIQSSGWVNSSGSYPKYYDIAVTGITAYDRADITIAPGSLDAAKSCGLCPTNETIAGKIRVRAVSVPSAVITAECLIEKGSE